MITLFEDNNGIIVRGDDPDWMRDGEQVIVYHGVGAPRVAQVERTPRDEGHRSWKGELAAPYDGAWDYMLRWTAEGERTDMRTIIIGRATHYTLEAK